MSDVAVGIRTNEPLADPWSQPVAAVLSALDVDPETGLARGEAARRLARYGPNRLETAPPRSAWSILAAQFKSLVVLLLVVAALASAWFGEWVEVWAILLVILINAAIGFVTELRAVRSMEALRKLGRTEAVVRRDGETRQVPAEDVVPGDIVLLQAGDVLPADVRLVEAAQLQVDESALTGESVPVDKQVEPIDAGAVPADRTNMAFRGTALTRGAGLAVVVATGARTQLGEISALVATAQEEVTPLERRLAQLARALIAVTLGVGVLVTSVGILTGKGLLLMIQTGIALAVASIPEGLSIVATLALARGMQRMSQRNALVNRLSAVETLGATSIIMTDKTGTLTENRMTVTELALPIGRVQVPDGSESLGEFRVDGRPPGADEQQMLRQALLAAVLSTEPAAREARDGQPAIGDPMDVALLVAGGKAGLDREELLERMPLARLVAFDPQTRRMATIQEEDGRYLVFAKGDAESLLSACSQILFRDGPQPLSPADREQWAGRNQKLAVEGLRVLGLACGEVEDPEVDPYHDLTWLGLVAFQDPPRSDVRAAIQATQRAGIRVVMVTGDQASTARHIALAIGLIDEPNAEVVRGSELRPLEEMTANEKWHLLDVPIFARVAPRQKLDLISLHQQQGAIVAMTGDGVNDAPALKKADIGVAMGIRGTQVAREAADMVLRDDAFSTIVAAVEQGRAIFANIRRFVVYLLACNVSEVLVIGLTSLINAPLPILPLQILFLNLVTDVFPALALGAGEGDPTVMDYPPRPPGEPIMRDADWLTVAVHGIAIMFAVLGAFGLALEWLQTGPEQAISISFLTLALTQLWEVFNMRDPHSGVLDNNVVRNPLVWGALALCVVLLLLAVYVPPIASVLGVSDPGVAGWALLVPLSLFPLLVGQVGLAIRSRGWIPNPVAGRTNRQ